MQRNLHETMDYHEALRNDTWKNERELADKILTYTKRHNLNYKLDKLTRGQGNCFPLSVLQQINQEDIFDFLMVAQSKQGNRICDSLNSDIRAIAQRMDHQEFRKRIQNFIINSDDERLTPMKINFNESMNVSANMGQPTETWQQYWERMIKDKEWVDSFFIQATAFFLNLDIRIIETACNQKNPFHEMKCGIPDSKTIHLGYVTATHYQSLILNENEDHKTTFPKVAFAKKDQVQCPICKKWFKNTLSHIEKSQRCKDNIDETDKIDLQRNAEDLKRINRNKRQKKYLESRRAKDPEKLKLDKIKHQWRYIEARKAKDPEKLKLDKFKHQKKYIEAKQTEDPLKHKIDQNMRQQRCRKIENEEDRLREFRKATMFGAIFLCISCHTRQFLSNVQEFTEKTEKELKDIWEPITLQEIIFDLNLVTKVLINYEGHPLTNIDDIKFKRYICKTCLKKLKKKTLPPMSVMNNLQLHDTDEDLKNEGNDLTELEGSLIAKLIIFQKIFLLPKSRWTALKDRTINVPVQDETINNFVKQLPRLPNEAGLIGLELKRKKEMKNVHKKQLINPTKIFRCLAKLKASGNPYYANIDTPEDFEKRCRENDKIGHDLIFGDYNDDYLEEIMEAMTSEFLENMNISE